MQIEIVGFITLLIGVLSFYLKPAFIVTAFFISTLLGSSAAMILDALGGASIPPAHVMAGFVFMRLMIEPDIRQETIRACRFPQPGFWLLFTVVYGAIATFFLPRLFADSTRIFAVRSDSGYFLVPLAPSTSNLTQSIYLISDFICFAALIGYFRKAGGKAAFAKAAIAAVILNLVFAVIDLATYWTGTAEFLALIRNANYRMLDDSEVAGFKRIVGSFAEASVFGATTLAYFAFVFRLWLRGVSPALTLTLSLLSLVGLIFSTSTTAYVGLAAFLGITYLLMFLNALFQPATPQSAAVLGIGPILAAAVVLSLALNDDSWNYLYNLFDTMIFSKMSTQSGVERSSWNGQAMQNFFDTYGFGAGNGSLRASSFPVAVLASLGFIGAATYFLFIAGVLLPKSQEPAGSFDHALRESAQSTCLAWMIAVTIAGAFVDVGLYFFIFAAFACAGASPPPRSARSQLIESAAVAGGHLQAERSPPSNR